MIKSFFIVQLSQNENLVVHEIKKINEQPKNGFRTTGQAETHLNELLNSEKYPFKEWYNNFSILPFYTKMEV